MDSLLATYSSSDEEDGQTPQPPQRSLLSSLPKPQSTSSSSIFSSLPPPKSTSQTLKQQQDYSSSSLPKPLSSSKSTSRTLKPEEDSLPSNSTSSLFSSLPPPKSETTTADLPLPPPKPKRVVQFRPPVPQPQPQPQPEDEEEEEEDEDDKQWKKQAQLVQDASVKSFLSSMPAPKSSGHTSLGAGASSLGSGRRSILETEAPTSNSPVNDEVGYVSNNYEAAGAPGHHQGGYAADYGGAYSGNSVHYGGYDTSNWYNNGGETAASPSVAAESFDRLGGKRRKDQPPAEIIEVKQDELMKNRPTEDKSKLTGIAFGPSYQPVSTKGKPSKLHKRKHQIGALYFDMKQKEMELTERRARGFLTKAETQAKYGW